MRWMRFALALSRDPNADEHARLSDLFQQEADYYRQMLGLSCRVLPPEAQAEEGMAAANTHGALHVPVGFALNPRKYVLGLARACAKAGARIHSQTPVADVMQTNGRFTLKTPQGEVTARKVIFATNGYSREDLPGWYAMGGGEPSPAGGDREAAD